MKNPAESTLEAKLWYETTREVQANDQTQWEHAAGQGKLEAIPKDILRNCHIAAASGHVKTQESHNSPQGIAFYAHLFSGVHT